MKSLAEHLGVQDPGKPDEAPAAAPPQKMTAKAFSRAILDSVQYRESLLRRILLDDLPPAIECLLYHYAYGKPVERIETKDLTPTAESLTPEQLEERAARLQEMAMFLRRAEQFDEPVSQESVH